VRSRQPIITAIVLFICWFMLSTAEYFIKSRNEIYSNTTFRYLNYPLIYLAGPLMWPVILTAPTVFIMLVTVIDGLIIASMGYWITNRIFNPVPKPKRQKIHPERPGFPVIMPDGNLPSNVGVHCSQEVWKNPENGSSAS
jgi:hypothetical protein